MADYQPSDAYLAARDAFKLAKKRGGAGGSMGNPIELEVRCGRSWRAPGVGSARPPAATPMGRRPMRDRFAARSSHEVPPPPPPRPIYAALERSWRMLR